MPSNDTHWARIVLNQATLALVEALQPESLDVLEISGEVWKARASFRSYRSVHFPAFDLCEQRLDEKFDLIIAEQVFEHLLWPYRAGRNALQMLEPGGSLLITTPFLLRVHEHPHDCTRWTETGLKHFLAECGFPLDQIQTGSWGNRDCIIGNFDTWPTFEASQHSLENEPALPVVVWALARRGSRINQVEAGTKSPSDRSNLELCLPAQYQHRARPKYFVDDITEQSGVVWQPDVYEIFARLATAERCTHLIDVGCGYAEKLVLWRPQFQLVGIDYGPNIQKCRDLYPHGTWLEMDLESGLPSLPEIPWERAAIVCSDVIEHLCDPLPLLNSIKDCLQQAPLAVISTPDRVRMRGAGHLGPPPNPHHVREWSVGEFEQLLRKVGMPFTFIGNTRSNDVSPELNTILAVCGLSE